MWKNTTTNRLISTLLIPAALIFIYLLPISRPTDSGENIDGDEILSCLQSGWLNTWNGIIRSHATHLANGRISECSKKRLQIIAEGIREIKNFIDTMSWRK